MPRLPMTETELSNTRAAILTQAAKIVGHSGLAGLSMRRLAATLKLTPGAIYRYFPSKQDLLWAFWQDALADLRSSFEEIDSSTDDPLLAIGTMLRAYADFGLADRDRFRLLFLENDQGLTNVLEHDEAALAPYANLRRRVAQAISTKMMVERDVERTTQMLWACVHGAVTLTATINEIDFGDVDQLIDATIDTVMRGLAA
ncbi:TetR/AcrR family transcriptional regulator [Mesorhizobium sp. M0830]|uniref:TetR/AcrR family transcriptional regulator n=1 Tax=Mesorhizobium sp. M0830 TaxID=2957008 RepID=UPI0033365E06